MLWSGSGWKSSCCRLPGNRSQKCAPEGSGAGHAVRKTTGRRPERPNPSRDLVGARGGVRPVRLLTASSMRLDSRIRNSLRVGRLTSTATTERTARCAPMPARNAVTTPSPASTSAGDEATDASNHGSSMRSSRARSGSAQAGPRAAIPQSTKTISPPGRRSRLSTRMSQWATCGIGRAAWSRSTSAQPCGSVRSTAAGRASYGRRTHRARRCHDQPRRSASQSQQTSPCQRWWSRRWGDVEGAGSSHWVKK